MKNKHIDYIKFLIRLELFQVILVILSLTLQLISHHNMLLNFEQHDEINSYITEIKLESYKYQNLYEEYTLNLSENEDYEEELKSGANTILINLESLKGHIMTSQGSYTKYLDVEDDTYNLTNLLVSGSSYSEIVKARQLLNSDLATLQAYLDEDSQQKTHRANLFSNISALLSAIVIISVIFIFLINIKSLRMYDEQTEMKGCTDELTGVFNRKYIEKHLSDYIKESGGGYLYMCDMDHFKQVNDTLGHEMGDEVLKDFARILMNTLRENDRICRLGGDEFMLYAPGVDQKTAKVIYKRIRNGLKDEFENTPKDIVTLSCGSTFVSVSDTFEEAYGRADKALYVVKENGRNNYFCIDGKL